MNRAILILLLCGVAGFAQSKFTQAVLGVARDSQQQLRRVDGVAGNFVLVDAIGTGTVDWAFGSTGGVVKTDTELVLLDAHGAVLETGSAPKGAAVLSTTNAFFAATNELWAIGAKSSHPVAIDAAAIAGSVIALGPGNTKTAELAVCRAKQLWLVFVDQTTGAIARDLPVGGTIGEQACQSAPADSLVVLSDGLLLATAQELLVETSAGVERRIPISTGHSTTPELHRVSDQWVEVESAGAPALMLHITADGETLYQLPAAKESK